jgi:hypothetical protein
MEIFQREREEKSEPRRLSCKFSDSTNPILVHESSTSLIQNPLKLNKTSVA